MPWASFSMLDGPGGTGCVVPNEHCIHDIIKCRIKAGKADGLQKSS